MHQPSRPARAAPRAAVWLLLASALLLSDSLLVEAAETLPSRFPPLALTFDTTIPDSAALLTPSFTDLTIDDPSLYILFDKAFPIAVEGDHPFVVGSRYGAGRVVALGNEAILTRCCAPDTKGVDQFVINALGWLAGDSPTLPIRLAILQGDPTRNNKLATMAQSVVTLVRAHSPHSIRRHTCASDNIIALEVESFRQLVDFALIVFCRSMVIAYLCYFKRKAHILPII